MKKLLFSLFKFLGFLILLIIIVGAVWCLRQPKLPLDHAEVRHQILSSESYQHIADSSIAILQNVISDLNLPSLSVAVSVQGEVVWAGTFGYSDLKNDHYPNLNTRYRAGSVSKSMTGLTAAKLVEKGVLDLDESFYTYVPSFPKKNWDFTLRQLGAHTAGIRHYAGPGKGAFWSEQFSKHHYDTVEESIGLFKNDDLKFQPGTDFLYSTHGFSLLSLAMEKAAKKDFISIMQEYLWTPHNMINTQADDYTKNDSQRAIPYSRRLGRLIHTEGPDPSYKWAGGGILTTPSDLVIMGGAFALNEITDSSLEDDLFTVRSLSDGSPNPQEYALGWRNGRSSELLGISDTLAVRHHGGTCPGGSSFILVVPEADIAVSTMTNYSLRNSWPLRSATFKIAGLFIKNQAYTDARKE